MGDEVKAAEHRKAHQTYKQDDQARESVVSKHRSQNPAARAATEAIVLYDLHRSGAPGLEPLNSVAKGLPVFVDSIEL